MIMIVSDMNNVECEIRNKRGTKQKDGGRIYIIRYYSRSGKKKIRIKEEVDTDTTFHAQDQIKIKNDGTGLITITNTTRNTNIKGHLVKY